MSDADDHQDFLEKEVEVTIVKPKLTPEAEDRIRKAIQKTIYYGGSTGAMLLTGLMPLSLFILHFMCFKDTCSISSWTSFSFSINELLDSAYYFGCILLPIFIIYNLPIGVSKLGEPMMNGDREKHRLQAVYVTLLGIPFSSFILLPFFYHGQYSGFQYNHVYDNFHYYIMVSTIFSICLSIYLYMRSSYVPRSSLNIHGNTGSPVYDFFMGKEMQPTLLKGNLKALIIISSFVFRLIIDVALIQCQMIQRSGFGSPTLLLGLFGNFLLGFDYPLFEEQYLPSMTMKYEGVGFNFIFTKLVLEPMLITYNIRYIYINQYELTAEPVMILLFGIIACCILWNRFIVADRSLFTRYKDSAEVSTYSYILSPNGKRLLVDGWWSGCRHPNYLCTLCMTLACCLVTGFSGILPYSCFIYQVIYLVNRIKRNEDLCRFEYGEAWDIYCQKVPYKLIKYIY
ncbi:hypothetical protein CHUAL_011139 [Chamberlinius hualienensis]